MENQYIVDKSGAIKSVILDFATYQRLLEALEDANLGRIMEKSSDDEEISLDEAKILLGLSVENHI